MILKIYFLLTTVCLIVCIIGLLTGCVENTLITSPPDTADVLFVSNQDTGTQRKELYSLDIESGIITRLTYSNIHFFIVGMDTSRRYVVASCAEEDTDSPMGLGDEDRRSLWVFDLETNDGKRLTDPLNHAEGDSFSPDGEWIIFFMRLAGEEQSDIYKIKRDGSNITRLTCTLAAVEGDPCWSNDGKTIVFTYYDMNTSRFVIKQMDTDGNNIQLIYDGGEGVSTAVFPPGNYDPTLSPDDEWIVFERAVNYSEQNFGSGIWHIFKVTRNGSDMIDLSVLGQHADRAEYLPSFSPDGTSIIYGSFYESVDPNNSHVDLFMMDSINGRETRLTHTSKSNMSPIWIPKR